MSRFSEFYNRLSFRNTVAVEAGPVSVTTTTTVTAAPSAPSNNIVETAATAGISERVHIIEEPENAFSARSAENGGGFETRSFGPYTIDMEGNNPFIIRGNRDGVVNDLLNITPRSTGDFCVAELNGPLVNVSDGNLKNNVKTLQGVTDKLREIRGVRFNYIPESGLNPEVEHLGVIAQEVERVFPELVIDSKRGYKTMDYVSLSAVLLQAVKEQQEQIDGLKR
tara:strand:+ start:1202 stop:1873 length:672 start_codon:yes stop_codon:yes gene_type:complete